MLQDLQINNNDEIVFHIFFSLKKSCNNENEKKNYSELFISKIKNKF